MLTMEHVMTVLGAIVIASPVLLVFVLGISSLLDRKLSEQTTTTILQAGTISGLLAALAVLLAMLILGTRHVPIELGDWVVIPGQYHFSIKFVFDRLSVPMAILSFTLSGTIGAFASRYMHRDAGYNRFFVLYTLFVLGMVATSLAGTIETLFAGWELVGLSSALLVAFFQERKLRRGTACGSGPSTGSRTPRCCWPRWPCTTCAERETSTSCWGRAFGPRSCRA